MRQSQTLRKGMQKMSVINYQCPNCSAGLSFDSKTQKMVCEYCDSSFTVEELEALKQQEIEEEKEDSKEHWEGFDPKEWQEEEMQGMKEWNCPSCGARIFAEETAGAMKCPYCDNPMVMPEQFSGVYLPDYIIPFKKSKKDAVEALKKHYGGKPLLPKVFKNQNHLEEVKAVYVPFWMFDVEAYGRCRYEATRIRFYEDSEYRYTETRYYLVTRDGNMEFVRIPVDGSQKIEDTMMEAIEPYDYRELEPFQISYLSGYLADKYDVEPDALSDRVHERVEKSIKDRFRETVMGYDSVIPRRERICISKGGAVAYALLPVWFLNTKWNGETYSFAMNGQTGKLIGDLPIGRKLMVKYWLRHHIPLTAALTAIFLFLRFKGVI